MSFRVPTLDEIMNVAASRGSNSDNPLAWDGLVFGAPFQEGAGLRAFDPSGFGNHSTLTNGPTWVAASRGGRALDFDGSDDFVQIVANDSNHALQAGFAAWTVSAWTTISSGGSGPRVLFNAGGIGNGFAIGYRTTPDTIVFLVNTTGTDVEIASVTTFPEDDTLLHIAAVYDRGAVRLSLNGIQESSGSGGSTVGSYSNGVYIGGTADVYSDVFGNNPTFPWSGQISNVHIYDRPLTPSEISDDYADPWAMWRLRQEVFPAAVAPSAGNPWYYYAQQA